MLQDAQGRLTQTNRVVPPALKRSAEDQESLDVWGFQDTRFEMLKNGGVVLTGTRYELCGQVLPHLVPWISDVMGVAIDPLDVNVPHYPPAIPEARREAGFWEAVRKSFKPDQISEDPLVRLRHGHGHTQFEMYSVKYGVLKRVPDLVVWPENEAEVTKIVAMAKMHGVTLIPFGGGTSVTEALLCPESETRSIVSVDMRRMNRILWIDTENRMACIEAGMAGRHIVEQLASYGFTMGHEPDSIEFSTLGGWVATHASGMKKNRYGNIEDLILDITVVTAEGNLARSSVLPRESVGLDPRQMIFGSEGTLGIVTSAVVKLFPLPETQQYDSVLFHDFNSGIRFLNDLSRQGVYPASMRLVDNIQFQFGMSLKPAASGFKAIKSKIEKLFVTKLKGFNPQKMVALTLVFEGTRKEVAFQRAAVTSTAKKYGGMPAGAENGRRGYQLTFGIAYIRDFVMKHYVLAESFETSVPWNRVEELCTNVKNRILAEHKKHKLPGNPFISCRVTQVYETGVCVYFYLGFYFKGVEQPTQIFAEIEDAARQEILANGGSLSHHHGIGKLREKFLPEIKSETALAWTKKIKKAVDPQGVFGSANQTLEANVSPNAYAGPVIQKKEIA